MSAIEHVHARQIFDSRGNPTIEVDVRLASGAWGRAAVPSGASTGTREALELRDGGAAFGGKGVRRAIENVNGEIAKAVTGLDADDQRGRRRGDDRPGRHRRQVSARRQRDPRRLDGRRSGGVRGRGRAACGATWAADEATLLPVPTMNVLNGGVHADNPVDFQEFMIAPVGAGSFAQAMQMGTEVYHELQRTLKSRGLGTAVGDEGGFAPDARLERGSPRAARERDQQPPDTAPGTTWRSASIPRPASSSRTAATSWPAKVDRCRLRRWSSTGRRFRTATRWCRWRTAWPSRTGRAGAGSPSDSASRLQLVADDIFVTNPAILREGIDRGVANSILIKLNQIGTLTETLDTIALARDAGYRAVISHRSGETEDTFIADLVVATGVGQIKTGAPARSERVAKYNQLLRIEEELGERARYAGREAVALGLSPTMPAE